MNGQFDNIFFTHDLDKFDVKTFIRLLAGNINYCLGRSLVLETYFAALEKNSFVLFSPADVFGRRFRPTFSTDVFDRRFVRATTDGVHHRVASRFFRSVRLFCTLACS